MHDQRSSLPSQSSSRRSWGSSCAGRWRPRHRRPGRRPSMTTSRPSPASIRISSVPSARLRRTPSTTGSSSTSTVAGAQPAYQEHLLDEAVSKYGSRAEAARWVATPEHLSARVRGRGRHRALRRRDVAVRARLRRTGCAGSTTTSPGTSSCGPDAIDQGCPARYADPTHDPRMQEYTMTANGLTGAVSRAAPRSAGTAAGGRAGAGRRQGGGTCPRERPPPWPPGPAPTPRG